MSVKEDKKAKAYADEQRAEAVQSLALIQKTKIRKQADLERMLQNVTEIKEAKEQVELQRSMFIEPLENVIKLYRGYFKPALDSLTRAEAAGKEAMEHYLIASETERVKLLDAVEDAHTEAQREALIAKADTHDIAPIAGLVVRKTWTGEVVDEKKIPREYMEVSVTRLKKATQAAGKDPKIPGWRAFVDVGTSVTVGKVQR